MLSVKGGKHILPIEDNCFQSDFVASNCRKRHFYEKSTYLELDSIFLNDAKTYFFGLSQTILIQKSSKNVERVQGYNNLIFFRF